MFINVNNEFGTLRSVLVASAETYFKHTPINNNQAHYLKEALPEKEAIVKQQADFFNVLSSFGVSMLFSEPLYDCPEQHNSRDASFSIGNMFFVSNMKESLRSREREGLKKVIQTIDTPVFYLEDCLIEGGDILVNGTNVYVGISQRTTMDGFRKLEHYLGSDYHVSPIYMKPGFLHLDTVFNIVYHDVALVCEQAIFDESLKEIKGQFSTFDISLDEQFHLGTNVLSIAPKRVISQLSNKRINSLLTQSGFDVIEIDYSQVSKLGGAFRCDTCPLIRDDV